MAAKKERLTAFLKELMRRRKLLPRQLAYELGVSHAAISRWLSGKDVPSIKSCLKLAEYGDLSVDKVLSLAGYLPESRLAAYSELPNFRDYARKRYPSLDEDLVIMIEDLIERKRAKGKEPR